MRRERQPCVYILASGRNGTLYIGVTSNLVARLHEHRASEFPGFAKRYGVMRLVHFEIYDDMPTAIAREKQLKRWRREWKCNLIERDNPDWADLATGLGFTASGRTRTAARWMLKRVQHDGFYESWVTGDLSPPITTPQPHTSRIDLAPRQAHNATIPRGASDDWLRGGFGFPRK